MWEMDHVVVTGRDDFEMEPASRSLVVEIRPDEGQGAAFWEAWRETE